jgi:hypothetical protein
MYLASEIVLRTFRKKGDTRKRRRVWLTLGLQLL